MARESVVGWGATSVRAVLFGQALSDGQANELFTLAFDQSPSNFSSSPPGSPSAGSIASAFDKLSQQFSLQAQPGRIDLLYSPAAPSKNSPQMTELIDLIATMDRIQDAATKICERSDIVSRLAMIVDLSKSEKNIEIANEYICKILPFDFKLKNELDFVLQFGERHSPSNNIEDIDINILYRYSVNAVQQFMLSPMVSPIIGNFGSPFGINPQNVASYYLAQLSIDVNTIPEAKPFPGASSRTILRGIREKIDQVRRRGPIGVASEKSDVANAG